MGSNADSTNTSALPEFSGLKEHERRGVILRSTGKSYDQITNHINNEFALTYSVRTVEDWFVPGGRLEQAFSEYNEALAAAALRDARQIIKKGSKAAAANLVTKLASHDDRVSLDASKAILNKYVPDRQIVTDGPLGDEELPNALADVGDALLSEGEEHGSEQVDDAPQGGATDPGNGSTGGEDVPAGVLPEPPAADNPGN